MFSQSCVVDCIGQTSKPTVQQRSFRNDLIIVLEAMTVGNVEVLMMDDNRFLSVIKPAIVLEMFTSMVEAFLQATMVEVKDVTSVTNN